VADLLVAAAVLVVPFPVPSAVVAAAVVAWPSWLLP
jgi:hypothetical protein